MALLSPIPHCGIVSKQCLPQPSHLSLPKYSDKVSTTVFVFVFVLVLLLLSDANQGLC